MHNHPKQAATPYLTDLSVYSNTIEATTPPPAIELRRLLLGKLYLFVFGMFPNIENTKTAKDIHDMSTQAENSANSGPGISQAIQRYWGVLVMIAWGGALLGFGLVRFDAYGLDEGAARGLLLNWSIVDNIVIPIVTLGIPDFRALLFVPLGIYWPGNIIAAKVFSLLIAFATVTMLYKWSKRTADSETANMASALLLVSPLLIKQIDAIGIGVFLLLAYSVGAWLDDRYRQIQRPLGGWFFVQLIWLGITVTIHPAGLAYPIALAWCWYRNPVDARQQRHVFLGTALVTILIVVTRWGWQALNWLQNPLAVLAQAFQPIAGMQNDPSWYIGVLFAALLVLIIWKDRRFLISDQLAFMLVIGLVLGLLAADDAWALLALVLILFRGIPYLIGLNQSIGTPGLIQKRGIVLGVIFIIATSFMMVDKTRARAIAQDQLNPQDELIHYLANIAQDTDKPFQAASQWPGRTAIACKRDVFPLPPPTADSESLLQSMKGITHLMFDPYDPRNKTLGRHIAELGGATQTIALQAGGVIIKVRKDVAESMTTTTDDTVPGAATKGQTQTNETDSEQ